MLLTYDQHGRMWHSPSALEAIIRSRVTEARQGGRVQETEELWQLYRRYCQRPVQLHERTHA